MAVTYTVIPRANPSDRGAPEKFYARAKASGELTFRNLSKEIAQGSTTVSDTDVLAVLNDLVKILRRHLENGRIVRFGDFGAFQVSLSSEGVETEDKFRNSHIRSGKIVFRPGVDLKDMLATLKFSKL